MSDGELPGCPACSNPSQIFQRFDGHTNGGWIAACSECSFECGPFEVYTDARRAWHAICDSMTSPWRPR